MKKENKELAQKRRAAEREKAAKRASLLRALKLWVPVVLAVVIVIVLIVAIATSGNNPASDNTVSDNTSSDSTVSTDTESSAVLSSETEESSVLDTTPGVAVENGDVVNIDYTGYIDGEAFSGGSTDGAGADLEIGSGSYIEGFEEGIIGHTIGETFDLNLSFPEDYWNSDLAGKEVVFNTTINGIYE